MSHYFGHDKSGKRKFNFEQLMIANEETIAAIFKAMEGEVDMSNNGRPGFVFDKLEVPITKDIYGLTALDVILGVIVHKKETGVKLDEKTGDFF